MITLPPAVLAALDGGRYSVRHMLKASLLSGDAGLWTGEYGVTYGGVVYKPLAGNMAVDGIPGSGEMRADQVQVTLAGLMADALALVDDADWHQRPAVIYVAMTDDAGSIVHAQAVFTGFIDQAVQSDQGGDVASLVVTLESSNREMDRASERQYSDADQRAHGGATDTFLSQMASSNANLDIYWGQANPK